MEPDEPIRAVYHLDCPDARAAEGMAREIAYEQTVEIDEGLILDPVIREGIVGRVHGIEPAPGRQGLWRVTIDYPSRTAAGNLPQLVNVLFGNISIKRGIRLMDFDLPEPLARAFPGPQFGAEGIRRLAGVPRGPLLATALKPMGLSPAALARLAEGFARGGIPILKDDHGLADHPFCSFEERVRACVAAVRRAGRETGRKALYFVNLVEPSEELERRAHLARDIGADGFLVSPFLIGLDRMRALVQEPGLDLPIMAHPSFSGANLVDPSHGVAPGALLGKLFRLAGADMVVYPNVGGRFPLEETDCGAIARALRSSHPVWKRALPAPAGGISLKNIPAIHRFYGDDVVLLVGASLYRESKDPESAARLFRQLAEGAGGSGSGLANEGEP